MRSIPLLGGGCGGEQRRVIPFWAFFVALSVVGRYFVHDYLFIAGAFSFFDLVIE